MSGDTSEDCVGSKTSIQTSLAEPDDLKIQKYNNEMDDKYSEISDFKIENLHKNQDKVMFNWLPIVGIVIILVMFLVVFIIKEIYEQEWAGEWIDFEDVDHDNEDFI